MGAQSQIQLRFQLFDGQDVFKARERARIAVRGGAALARKSLGVFVVRRQEERLARRSQQQYRARLRPTGQVIEVRLLRKTEDSIDALRLPLEQKHSVGSRFAQRFTQGVASRSKLIRRNLSLKDRRRG